MILLVPIYNWQFAVKGSTVVFGFDLWLDPELIFGSEFYCIWTELQLTPLQFLVLKGFRWWLHGAGEVQGGCVKFSEPTFTSSEASFPKHTMWRHREKHAENFKHIVLFLLQWQKYLLSDKL